MSSEPLIVAVLRERGWTDGKNARCPVPGHGQGRGDRQPSLAVNIGPEGQVLLHCHAGCSMQDVVGALGCQTRDLFIQDAQVRSSPVPGPTRFLYCTIQDITTSKGIPGDFLARLGVTDCPTGIRIPYKDDNSKECAIRFRHFLETPEGSSRPKFSWEPGTKVRPYFLDQLSSARHAGHVALVEGESDVWTLAFVGIPALGIPGNATWRDEWASYLNGIGVIYAVQEPGRSGEVFIEKLAASPLAARLRVVRLTVKDPNELWMSCGQNHDRFRAAWQAAIDAAVPISAVVTPSSFASSASFAPAFAGIDLGSPACAHPTEAPELKKAGQPVLGDTALVGPIGELVRWLAPQTEASRAALLAQFLVAFGNAAGRNAFVTVGADRHYANLFAVLVGNTSRARKGTAFGYVKSILHDCDPAWSARIRTGLSTGEGIIAQVEDASASPCANPGMQSGQSPSDKRLLAHAPEFGRVLKTMARDGNTLSAVLRELWDSGDAGTLTKGSPQRATGAYVSLIGHITTQELRSELRETDAANGFGNRILWCAVHRERLLPRTPPLDLTPVRAVVDQIREALQAASVPREVERTEDFWKTWESVYPELTTDRYGLLGAVTSRAEAQVLRLALGYALAAGSSVIDSKHLDAALSLWRYCDASALYVFGDSLGDSGADAILEQLRDTPGGMTRTEISNLVFNKHRVTSRIVQALHYLRDAGKAVVLKGGTGGGRPAERWFAIEFAAAKEAKEAKEGQGPGSQAHVNAPATTSGATPPLDGSAEAAA